MAIDRSAWLHLWWCYKYSYFYMYTRTLLSINQSYELANFNDFLQLFGVFFSPSVDRHYKNIVHGIRKCFVCMPFFLRALIGYLKFWAFSDTKNWSQFNSRIVEAFEYTIRTHVFCQLRISKKCFQKFHTKEKKNCRIRTEKALNKTDVFLNFEQKYHHTYKRILK